MSEPFRSINKERFHPGQQVIINPGNLNSPLGLDFKRHKAHSFLCAVCLYIWDFLPDKRRKNHNCRAGGGRTHTMSPSGDFKSPASANSATAPDMELFGKFLGFSLYMGGLWRRKYGFFDESPACR